ncbi:hypothetical protein WJX75_009429 [Coccomyxa subellipsoidea]|uniref:Sec-independent protein translocase protein TatB n=1 Tax=Coccomyxa subellipsoidea TaxID=248742 RepID=A0ABR2YCS8_9CHLO
MMFFGFSYGEIIVTTAVLAVCIGPKELPLIAKTTGRLTGQAAAFLSRSRSQWQKFAEENEIAQLHREMQESLGQLRAIQNELRYGPHIMNPGPLAQRALKLPQQLSGGQGSAPNQAAAAAQIHSTLGRGPAASALDRLAAEEPALAQRLASIDPQLLQALQDHLAKGTLLGGTASLDRADSGTHRVSGSGGDQLSSRDTREDSSKRDGSAASSGTWGRNTVNSGVGSEGVYASGSDL